MALNLKQRLSNSFQKLRDSTTLDEKASSLLKPIGKGVFNSVSPIPFSVAKLAAPAVKFSAQQLPSYVQNRVVNQAVEGARQIKNPTPFLGSKRAGQLLGFGQIAGAAYNATPLGMAENSIESGLASALQSRRTKTPFLSNYKKNISDPYTGVASTGLGATGGLAMAGDILLNPGMLAASVNRIAPNAKRVLKGMGKSSPIINNKQAQDIAALQDLYSNSMLDIPDVESINKYAYDLLPQTKKQIDKMDLGTKIKELSSLMDKNQRYAMQELTGYMGIKGKDSFRGLPTRMEDGKQVVDRTKLRGQQLSKTNDQLLGEARGTIGRQSEGSGKSIRQNLDDVYTQWVDRFNPLSKASKQAKQTLRTKGASLRPEYDPDYLVRRLTGAGGISEYRFKTKLNPILNQMDELNIPKADMDVYLAHNRMLGFDEVGRDIYGVDPEKSAKYVQAIEAKYPNIKEVADQFYKYQDEGLKELADAGFFTPENIAAMRGQNPNYAPLYRVMDEVEDYLGLPTRKTMQGSSPVKKIKGSKRQILSPVESIIGNTYSQRAAIEKNRVAQSIIGLQQIAPELGFNQVSKAGPDTITVWRNGQKEYWNVGKDIADVAKGANEEVMNTVLKIIQAPASLLRQAATGRNPEFMIPNIIRDQIDAGISSKYGYIPFVDYVSGLRSMIKNDEVYQSWQNSGAKIDLGELSGKKSITKMFDEKTAKKGLFDWISKGLDVAGKYSEEPTRVGLYKKALKKTGNPLIAAMESRDATVDFARMGSKMKVANSIIPFLNVGVQGFDKLIRAGKNNPGKLALGMGVYAAAPSIMATMYNLINHKDEYAEIPQYEKDSNFVLVNGRNENGTVDYITIPKGNIVPYVSNPIQSFLEYLAGNDEQSFRQVALQTISEGLPVLSGGSSLKEIGIKTVGSNLPQIIKPVTENLINKSFYKYDENRQDAKEIVPFYLKDKPAYQQDYEFTPQMYKKIGAALNVSPLQVKNFMEGYFAGYTKIPSQVIEMLYKQSRGEEISPNDKTLVRRFVKQTYQNSSSKKKASRTPESPGFFDRITGQAGASSEASDGVVEYEDAETGYNRTIDIGRVTKMPENSNLAREMKQKEVWKATNQIVKADITPEQRQQALQALGVKPEEATYYGIAKYDSDLKMAYLKDVLPQFGDNREAMLKTLSMMRGEINGERILNNSMIDDLYDEGIIGANEKTMLKKLKFKDGKIVDTRMSGGKKIKVPSLVTTSQLLSAFNKYLQASANVGSGSTQRRSLTDLYNQRRRRIQNTLQ